MLVKTAVYLLTEWGLANLFHMNLNKEYVPTLASPVDGTTRVKANVSVRVDDFNVPNQVVVRPMSDAGYSMAVPLNSLDRATAEILCERFKAAVMERVGRE
jgi:hypothetical protein